MPCLSNGLGRNCTVGMSTPGTVSNLTYIDLQQHEATGGHTLRHHVHPTNAMLRQRLASNPQIPGVSKFTDHSTAERIVNMALQANLAQFNACAGIRTGPKQVRL